MSENAVNSGNYAAKSRQTTTAAAKRTPMTGVGDFIRAKLYPSLDAASRKKADEYAAALGIIDAEGNINADLLADMARAHIAEFGEIDVNLLCIGFALTQSHIDSLLEYIRKAS